MIKLRIDDREVQVEPGTTILQAAQTLDIPIPTMCHLPEFHNNTSCMICTVQCGDKMLPACSTRVSEGLEVETHNSEVVDFRKTTLELLFAEHVGECVAPCELACPAHLQIPVMMRQIENKEFQAAIQTIKQDIALPAVLGYICSAPCENSCRRKFVDEAASICMLKRTVALDDLAQVDSYIPEIKPSTGKKVAIIGAGPAGLTVAFYAQLAGHACTIIDNNPQPGGMLRYAISEAELPRSVLDQEIEQIARTGVKFSQDQRVGEDISFEEILSAYDAVAITIGKIDPEQSVFTGLDLDSQGVKINRTSFATNLMGVFAGGDCVHPRQMTIRSVADGKNIADSIDHYLSGRTVSTTQRVRSSLGKVGLPEIEEFLKIAAPRGDKMQIPLAGSLSVSESCELAAVCLQCGCRSAGSCELRTLADDYNSDTKKYQFASRPEIIRDTSHPWVIYEPGKCIKCGLCVAITRARGEHLGLTFIGRGFDVKVGVPFQESMADALKNTAEECVAACPTGAIGMKAGRQL